MSHKGKITPKLSTEYPLIVVSQDDTADDSDNDPHTKKDNGFFFRDNRKDFDIPGIVSRADPEGKNDKTEPTNDVKKPLHPNGIPEGLFPPLPIDIDTVEPPILPDVNVYQHKKTFAQGMMDLALFSANANQLRYVLESFSGHPYYYPSIVLISFSLIMQVAVGVGLVWNATYNVKDDKQICIANKINNFTVIGVFLVTVINVFISAFGVATAAPVT